MIAGDGRRRVVIEKVRPQVDCGRFPIKRTVGEKVSVEANIFADGHDSIACALLYRREGFSRWEEVPMKPLPNDVWRGTFQVTHVGRYVYTLRAWIDRFQTWQKALTKKIAAGQDVSLDLLTGAELVEDAARRVEERDGTQLREWAGRLRSQEHGEGLRVRAALSEDLARTMAGYPDLSVATTYDRELVVIVDREKARFSAWYEMFPRSTALVPGQHGMFADCETRLPYVAEMGFDVLYLPPVHPIGRTNRKGKNNRPEAREEDPGSPWAIGTEEGGHKDIHPQLGDLDDFRRLLSAAADYGIELAMDIAFQCSPDHPYVKELPDWFCHRPDGSVQFAENPPKRYEDIYPLDFETEDWEALWEELKNVLYFWIEQGIRIFRVDNPHTKPFRFWEWVISELKRDHPDVLFLSEAFTRPKVMYHLAKLGFTQSYTYFAWRNLKWELEQYFEELTRPEVRDFFRPNLWPNTPDILTEYLQMGGPPAFKVRAVLAATLGANYGVYGPAFEMCENRPRHPGSEEYLDSEKYEIRNWEITKPGNLKEFMAHLNRIRRQNPALQSDANLQFHFVDHPELICYSKHTEDLSNIILVVVNLDVHHTLSGQVHLPPETFGLDPRHPYQVHDLLSDARYLWHGAMHLVEINPGIVPAQVFRLRRRIRTERDFDYYL